MPCQFGQNKCYKQVYSCVQEEGCSTNVVSQKGHDGQAADGHCGEAPALEGHMDGSRGSPRSGRA